MLHLLIVKPDTQSKDGGYHLLAVERDGEGAVHSRVEVNLVNIRLCGVAYRGCLSHGCTNFTESRSSQTTCC